LLSTKTKQEGYWNGDIPRLETLQVSTSSRKIAADWSGRGSLLSDIGRRHAVKWL